MPKQTLKVEVDCDTPLEEVAEYRRPRKTEDFLAKDGVSTAIVDLLAPWLIVKPKQPKQKPQVSEQEVFEIPLRVTKEIYEKYSSGVYKKTFPGDPYLTRCGDLQIATGEFLSARLVLTPRVQYPPELRSPEIWGIVIEENGVLWVIGEEPSPTEHGWDAASHSCMRGEFLRFFFPHIKLPILADFGGDWTKAKLPNPDWKGK